VVIATGERWHPLIGIEAARRESTSTAKSRWP